MMENMCVIIKYIILFLLYLLEKYINKILCFINKSFFFKLVGIFDW